MRARTLVLLEVLMAAFAVFVLRSASFSDEELPNPHAMFNTEMPCLDCHDTYLDEVDEHEFLTGVTEICLDCHSLQRLGRSHPYDIDPEESDMEDLAIPEELPLADGLMTCGSCHNPHADYLAMFPRYENQPAYDGVGGTYYRSWYTRLPDPAQGWDRLCLACHPTK